MGPVGQPTVVKSQSRVKIMTDEITNCLRSLSPSKREDSVVTNRAAGRKLSVRGTTTEEVTQANTLAVT